MSKYSDFFPSSTGGGGAAIIGTESYVDAGSGKTYTVYSDPFLDNIEAFQQNDTVDASYTERYDGTIKAIQRGSQNITYSPQSIGNISTSPNNNIYTTFYTRTGAGVLYYAFVNAYHGLSITSASGGTRTGTMQVSIRLTIDGGTPIEFISNTNSLTSPANVTRDWYIGAGGGFGFGNFFDKSVTDYSSSSGQAARRSDSSSQRRFPFHPNYTNGTAGDFTDSMILENNLSTSNTVTRADFIAQDPESLRRMGVPGILYNTSVLIETKYNATRTGAWNGRGGELDRFCADARF